MNEKTCGLATQEQETIARLTEERLKRIVEMLDDLNVRLQDKLQPVMMPYQPKPCEKFEDDAPTVYPPLFCSMRDCFDSIDVIIDGMEDMYQRIEL